MEMIDSAAPERPVERLAEHGLNDVSDHDSACPPHQRRRHVVPDRGDEHQQARGDHPRQGQRQDDAHEGHERALAQVARGLDEGPVYLLQRNVDGQNCHRGPGVSQRDHHRGRVVEQELERTGNDPQGHESGIDDAVVAEDHLPREDTQEVAGPEGNRDQDDPHHLVLLHMEGDEVRQGIGQCDGDQRHQGRDSNGAVENQVVDLLFEEHDVILCGKGPDEVDVVLLPEAQGRQDKHGKEQPEHDHHQRRREQGISSRRLAPHEPQPHPLTHRGVGCSPRCVHERTIVDGATGGESWARPRHGIEAFGSLRSGYGRDRGGPPGAGRRYRRVESGVPASSTDADISSWKGHRGTSARWMPRNG